MSLKSMWIRDIEELGQELQDFHTWWRIQYLALSVGDVGGSRVGAPVAERHSKFVKQGTE